LENENKKLSRQFAEELGLARISISAPEAALISLLVKMHGCRKFVEIGTLTGLSAQYIFEALPEGGQLWTLEKDPRHGDKAAQVFSQLDQSKKKIHLVMGDAREELLNWGNKVLLTVSLLMEIKPLIWIIFCGQKKTYVLVDLFWVIISFCLVLCGVILQLKSFQKNKFAS